LAINEAEVLVKKRANAKAEKQSFRRSFPLSSALSPMRDGKCENGFSLISSRLSVDKQPILLLCFLLLPKGYI